MPKIQALLRFTVVLRVPPRSYPYPSASYRYTSRGLAFSLFTVDLTQAIGIARWQIGPNTIMVGETLQLNVEYLAQNLT